MRLLLLLALLAPGLPAHAADPKPTRSAAQATPGSQAPGPKSIGTFEDWQAATHQEAGALVCYAFARAAPSDPALGQGAPGQGEAGQGEAVLTVTHRTGGRDTVAVTSGAAYPAGSAVRVQVNQTQLPFYTNARSAFARDGKAAVAAFEKGRTAVARSPGRRGASASDTFSLRGFTAAYAAINKACPPR